MEIELINAGNIEYIVNSNQGPIFKGTIKFNWNRPTIKLTTPNADIIISLKESGFIFSPSFAIKINDEFVLFETTSFWRGTFECEFQSEKYIIVKHIGHIASVFKGKEQIAYYKLNKIVWHQEHKINLTCNKTENLPILVAIGVCLLEKGSNIDNNFFAYKFGKLFFEERPFNNNWKPE